MESVFVPKGTVMMGLVDADIAVYKAACIAERDNGEITEAISALERILESWTQFVGDYVCVFSDTKNFRKIAYPDYKSHRTQEPPRHLDSLRQYVKTHHRVYSKTMLEADDCIGIAMTKHPGKYMAISIDKDFMQIPGIHYNPDKAEYPFVVTEAQANWFRDYQRLVGDSSDGYIGAKGIGPKKAEKILSEINPDIGVHYETHEDHLKAIHLSQILRFSEVDEDYCLPEWFLESYGDQYKDVLDYDPTDS